MSEIIDLNDTIKILIENLPKIFIYFVPGAIFLSITAFICSKRNSDYKYYIFKSIVISYMIIKFIELIQAISYKISPFLTEQILAIIIAILSAYFLSILYTSSKFEKILSFFKINKTVHDNIWNDIIDYEKGTYILAYVPSEKIVYQGLFQRHEERDGDVYITISNYATKDYNNKVINNYKNLDNEVVMINTKNISRFEFTYSNESVKI